MAQKIEIDADLTKPYSPPEGASIDVLRELAQSAQSTALELLGDDTSDPSDEDFEKARWLHSALGSLQTTIGEIEEKGAEKKRVRDELKAQLSTDPEGGADGDGGEPTPAPAPSEPAPAEAALSAAAVPSLREIAKAAGAPAMPKNRNPATVTLVAAADVPGYANGQQVDKNELGRMFAARAKGLMGHQGDGRIQSGFANIRVQSDPALTASATSDDIQELLERITDESQLPGGSLTAAAGWCAPSEVDYNLLNTATRDGLVDLPSMTVTRGGVRYAPGPDFGTVYGNGGFTTLTESQAISGTTKNVFDIPCPSWTDNRMGADVAYFRGGILMQNAYPEGITDYITKALIAFDHLLSFNTISDIVAGSTAVDMTSNSTAPQGDFGATASILGSLELQAMDMKYRGRLGEGQSLEAILPMFARGIMRSDITKRLSLGPDDIALADAAIDNLFRVRGMNPQFVYDWQDNIASGGTANPFGAESSVASTWPQKFKALLYPAGTWARALSPVLELSTVYDSTLLTNNNYVALFTERGRLTLKKGTDSRVVTVASNPSGLTSGYVSQSHPSGATVY